MTNQTQTIKILNREKEYEDKLIDELNSYFISCLEKGLIKEISEAQKNKLIEFLKIIANESRKHSLMFGGLMDFILENGEQNY